MKNEEALEQGLPTLALLTCWTKLSFVGTVLCYIGGLAASLASTHSMPVELPNCNNQNRLETLPTKRWGQNSPELKTTVLEKVRDPSSQGESQGREAMQSQGRSAGPELSC